MAFSGYQIFLASLMLVTGAINTLSTKLADRQEGKYRDGISRPFSHPFLQAACMFFGESLCFVTFHLIYCFTKRRAISVPAAAQTGQFNLNALVVGNQNFNPFVFLPPAFCDMLGTSLAYIGLNLTYASSFQMLRGSVMIFTGLLSVAFLGREMQRYKWFGMVMVVAGLAIVGVTDFIFADKDATTDTNGIIAGDLLIIMGQIVTALQMVYEEKFVTKYNVPPLQAVGWEGIFGFSIISVLLVPMYFIQVPAMSKDDPNHRLENVIDAFHQMKDNPVILAATLGTIFSIAFFNFAGISVTKEMSATTRMVLDSSRTIIIWLFSILFKWQKFQALQLLGFVFLISGMFIYNNIIFAPLIKKIRSRNNPAESSAVESEEVNERSRLLGGGGSGTNESPINA